MATAAQSNSAFFSQLKRYYTFYTGGFIAFVILTLVLGLYGLFYWHMVHTGVH